MLDRWGWYCMLHLRIILRIAIELTPRHIAWGRENWLTSRPRNILSPLNPLWERARISKPLKTAITLLSNNGTGTFLWQGCVPIQLMTQCWLPGSTKGSHPFYERYVTLRVPSKNLSLKIKSGLIFTSICY